MYISFHNFFYNFVCFLSYYTIFFDYFRFQRNQVDKKLSQKNLQIHYIRL